MLRASSEINGETVNLQGIRSGDAADGVPHADVLLAWTDAASARDEAATARARADAVAALGAAGAVDAAAIMGNFERMTRIADGTGIPLDAPVNAMASDIQNDLGLREFRTAANTEAASGWATLAAGTFRPVVTRLLPLAAKLLRLRG